MARPLSDLTPKRTAQRAVLRGLLSFSIIVVALLVAELLLRVISFAEPGHSDAGDPGVGYQFDAEFGWFPIPNSSAEHVTTNRTVSVRHNSLGLRERELSDIAPDRVLFLGDSFTYGFDAEVNERFSDVLQKELPEYGMVNAGVSGFGTDQEFLLMKRLWNHVHPKIVVLTFCVDNDRDDNSTNLHYQKYYKPYFVRTPAGEWEIRGYPLPQIKRGDHAYGWVEHFALARFAVNAYWVLRNREINVPDPTEDLIGMMQRTTEARGARLIVGLQRHEPRLEAYLEAQKIPYTTFDDAQAYPTAGWHWTPAGNALVANKYRGLLAQIGSPRDPPPPLTDFSPPVSNGLDGQQLIARPSVLSPIIWHAAVQGLPGEFINLARYLQNWATAVRDSGGLPRVGIAALILTVVAIVMVIVWFRRRRRVTAVSNAPDGFSKAFSSFGVFLCVALAMPLIAIVLLEAAAVRMIEISYGLIASVVVAAFGRGVALGLFAPDASQRRLVQIGDLTARSLAAHLIWGTRALGALVLALAVNTALAAPAPMIVATNMLFALVTGALLVHLLVSQASSGGTQESALRVRWLRIFGWLILGVIAIALISGYPTFAAFVSSRLISILAIAGLLYLLVAFGNALFVERFSFDAPHSQVLAGNSVVSTIEPTFTAILSCSGMCLALMLATLVLYIGPW